MANHGGRIRALPLFEISTCAHEIFVNIQVNIWGSSFIEQNGYLLFMMKILNFTKRDSKKVLLFKLSIENMSKY